jgi:hypothetical protein
MTSPYILQRLGAIEHELAELRKRLSAPEKQFRKVPALYGILSGEEFSEEEIDEIGRSMFGSEDDQ